MEDFLSLLVIGALVFGSGSLEGHKSLLPKMAGEHRAMKLITLYSIAYLTVALGGTSWRFL